MQKAIFCDDAHHKAKLCEDTQQKAIVYDDTRQKAIAQNCQFLICATGDTMEATERK